MHLFTPSRTDRRAYGCNQGALAGETEQAYICALQCVMRGCLQKAFTMGPNAIFFLLHCGAKPQSYGLVLTCFSLLCNPGALSLTYAAFHIQSEKHAVSSPSLKLPAYNVRVSTLPDNSKFVLWRMSGRTRVKR